MSRGSKERKITNEKDCGKGAKSMMARTVDLWIKDWKQNHYINAMKREMHNGLNPIELDMPISRLSPTT